MSLQMLRRRPVVFFLLVFIFAVATAVLQGSPPRADAHALLTRAEPPVNAQLRDPPTALTLYFSEAVERKFSGVRVTDQNNARVDDQVTFDDSDNALIRVSLKTVTPGYLTVNWETVSAVDGHRVTGSYPLTILNADGSVPPGKAPTATASVSGATAKPLRVIDRWAILVSASLLAGAMAFCLFVTPSLPGEAGATARSVMERRAVLLVVAALWVLIPAGGIELLLQDASVGSGAGDVLGTSWGGRWLLRQACLVGPLLAVLLLAALPSIKGSLRRALFGLGLLGAAGYFIGSASSSHAAAGGGSFWGTASDFVHLLAAAVWLGMLALVIALIVWARGNLERSERFPVIAKALQSFSSAAVISVAVLLLTGTINSVIEIGRVSDMIDSGYGRTLLLKLFLILPLLAIGAVNAYVLRPRMVEAASARGGRGRPATLAELEVRLARGVRWELAAGVLVLAVAALLGQQTPSQGRLSDPNQGAGKFTQTQSAEGIGVTLVVDPNQPGINSFEVYLTGAVDVVESVRLDFKPPKGGDEARLIMDPSNPPVFYVGKGPYLSSGGKWGVAVDIRRSKGSDLLLPFQTNVTDPGAQVSTSRSGGAFASPVSFTPVSAALLVLSLALAGGLVFGSYYPKDQMGGFAGTVATGVSRRFAHTRIRPAWSLAGLLIVGVGLGLLIGAHVHNKVTPEEAKVGNPVATSPESVERGRILFNQNCTQCHGESGRGDGPLAKSLPIPPANLYLHIPYHPDQFFFGIITNGLSGIMPSFSASIGETDRWNILNYLRSQFSKDPAEQ